MSNIKLSIITVVYNGAKTIEKTIKSVIKQKYDDMQYIIIDGGSIDGTQEIIEKYRDMIDVYISEKDEGIYDAINKGIKLAVGEWIGLLNSDDYYVNNALTTIRGLIESNSEQYDIITAQINFVKDGVIIGQSKNNNLNCIWDRMPVAHPATFVKKDVYYNIGLYNTKYRIAADYDFIFRCYINKLRFLFVDNIVVDFSTGGISGTQKVNTYNENKKILEDYIEYETSYETGKKKIEKQNEKVCFYLLNKAQILSIIPQKFYIWGCGFWGHELLSYFSNFSINCMGFIDSNSDKWGTKVKTYEVYSPLILESQPYSVIIAVENNAEDIAKSINKINKNIETVSLEQLFSRAYMLKNRNNNV